MEPQNFAHAPFPITPYLTSIAVAYRNGRMISDAVLPRVPVGRQDFKYTKYALADSFTVPDTKVGRKSKPNEAEWGGTEATDSTVDWGLDAVIPQADIDNAQGLQFDPLGRATELLTDLTLLDREIRVANLVFNANSYAAANKSTLAGNSQWSDFVNSDPIGTILAALDGMLVRPNVCVLGRAVFTKLIQHPKIVAAAFPLGGNASVGGKVALEAIRNLLELEEMLIGEGFYNSAKPGQAATVVRVWGKHAAFFVRDQQATTTQGMSFGITAQWGSRIAGSWEDKDIGLRGGQRVRMGESVKELITANDLGYFFQNAVA